MRTYPGVSHVILLVSICVCLASCLPSAKQNASQLLEEDYQRMTDSELVAYEQQLSDELVRAGRSDQGGVSVGLGFGSWGSNTGYGVGVEKSLAGTERNETSMDLEARRDKVRTEMKRRGLLP